MFSRNITSLCVVLTLAPLVGCVRFHPQPIDAAKGIVSFEGQTLETPELKQFIEQNTKGELSWPLSSWDFDHLLLTAFYYHPDIDVARARWGVVKAGLITAGERPNPTVSFSPVYDTTTPPPWILGVNFDIPIETAGKRGYRIAQARHLSDAARLNIATAAWNVRSRLRRQFLTLYAAEQRHGILRHQQTVASKNLQLLEKQRELGAISRFELTQARLASENVQLATRDAEIQLEQAKVDLAVAVGVPVTALNNIKISFTGIDQVPSEIPYVQVRRTALLNRSDVLSALAEYAAAESALRLELAKQYPDVHLNPGYQLDQTDNKWGLGIAATLPVLNQNKGAIGESEARRKELATRFGALQASVIGEIDRAFAGYRAVLKKQATAESTLQQQAELMKSSEALFQAGETSRLEVVAAELELNSAKLNQLNTTIETQVALGALEDAIQHPINNTEPSFTLSQSITNK